MKIEALTNWHTGSRFRQAEQRSCRRYGLTLIEVTVSSLLVGLIFVAAMRSTGAVFQARNKIAHNLDAAGLAHELMSEILAQNFEDPDQTPPVFGPDPGETTVANSRQDFDDVDDYNGWSSTPPRFKASPAPRSEFTGFQRTVAVVHADPDAPTTTSGTDKDLKRITVTVTGPVGDLATLVVFRSRWGALQQSPSQDETVTTWVGAEIQIGTGTPKTVQGTSLTNHAED